MRWKESVLSVRRSTSVQDCLQLLAGVKATWPTIHAGTYWILHAHIPRSIMLLMYIANYCIQRNGQFILWAHLHRVFEQTHCETGLYTSKLKAEHLNLTSYSKMRVDLAAQVYIIYIMHLCIQR
jgi:hypothetical protein